MLKYFLIYFSLFLVVSGFAQDTIVKRNNEKIIAKVLEVNQQEVKYKQFTFQDGPTYIVSKSEIKSIRYSNGSKEVFSIAAPAAESKKTAGMMQPKDDYWYYYNDKVIAEPVMLETAEKLKDPKVHHFIKKTRSYVALKQGAKISSITLAAGSLLVLTGIINFKNTAGLAAAAAPTKGGPRGGNKAAQTALVNTRKANAGKVFLGAVGAAALSLTFKFGEKKNAHLVCDLFNLSANSSDYSH